MERKVIWYLSCWEGGGKTIYADELDFNFGAFSCDSLAIFQQRCYVLVIIPLIHSPSLSVVALHAHVIAFFNQWRVQRGNATTISSTRRKLQRYWDDWSGMFNDCRTTSRQRKYAKTMRKHLHMNNNNLSVTAQCIFDVIQCYWIMNLILTSKRKHI